MKVSGLAQSLKVLTSATGRRGAMRSFAAGMASLAALGLADGAAGKNAKHGRGDVNSDRKKRGKAKVGPTGPTGPAGAAGGTGPQGPAGLAGISGDERVMGPGTPVDDSNSKSDTAPCPTGKKVLGGGYNMTGSESVLSQISVSASFPENDTEWTVDADEDGEAGGTWSLQAWAVCANVT